MSESQPSGYEWDSGRSEVVTACIDYAVKIGQRLVASNVDAQKVVDRWIEGVGEWGSDYEFGCTDSPPPSILQFLQK